MGIAPWWLEIDPMHVEVSRDRLLTVDQIAQILFAAERYKVLPGRKQHARTSETVLAALWWIVLTAQRTGASMLLRKDRIVPDLDARGWYVATWPAENMKSRRFHALPLPPRVYEATVGRARKDHVRPESMWAFPSRKSRRRGTGPEGDIVDMHIADAAVNLLIRRLRGRDEVGVARGAPDLLAGIPEFSPHDLRRSLTTHLSDRSIRGDAASAILDHSSQVPGEMTFAEADVTRLSYNKSQKLDLKNEALSLWSSEIFAAFDALWEPYIEHRRLTRKLLPTSATVNKKPLKKLSKPIRSPEDYDPGGRGPTDDEWEEIEAAEQAVREAERALDLARRRARQIDLSKLARRPRLGDDDDPH